MFILHGQKSRVRTLGIVADGCVQCMVITPHMVDRLGLYRTIYFIPIGCGRNLGITARCTECGSETLTDPQSYSRILKPALAAQLAGDKLIEQTNPNASAELSRRLGIRHRLASGESLPEDRIDHVIAKVFNVNVAIFPRIIKTHIDVYSGLMLIVLLAGLVGAASSSSLPASVAMTAILACYCVAAIGLIGFPWALLTDVPRFIRRSGQWDALVASLQETMPDRVEIGIAFEKMKRMGVPCAEHIKWRKLANAVWTVDGQVIK